MGSDWYYFVSNNEVLASAHRSYFGMYSNGGTAIVEDDSTYHVSNWVITDFDKNGFMEACIGYWDVDYWLKCVDETGTNTRLWNLSLCGGNFSQRYDKNNIVIADFKVNSTYMGIATGNNIYYHDGTTCTNFYTMGTTYSARPIVVIKPGTLQPYLIYGDSLTGYILRNSVSAGSCGNGICDAYENMFNCPADCPFSEENGTSSSTNLPIGSFANKNASNCLCGYVEYERCALLPFKMACTSDSCCASGDCDSGGHCTQMTLWNGISASKTLFFGSDTNSGNLIALVIMIISSIAAGSVSIILAPFVFVAEAIFFTIIGWLSVFILVGIILVGIIAGVLAVLMNTGG